MTNDSTKPNDGEPDVRSIVRRHLQWGWLGLFVFGSVGLAIEALHGFKLDLYLNVENETRRLMWTLGHAHGTLLSLTQIAFAASIHGLSLKNSRALARASKAICIAQTLIPGGFLAGGIIVHGGDPNLTILLVPLGAICFLYACGAMAGIMRKAGDFS